MRPTDSKCFFLLILLSSVLFSILISCKEGDHQYKLRVIRSGNGWGYDITVNNRPYIHQPFIPAVEGNIPFSDRKTARKTGRIVIQRLKDHKPPGLTREEVEKICNPETENRQE